MKLRALRPTTLALIGLATALPALAADFAEITAEERALTDFPGVSNPPAVILFQRARVELMNYPKTISSRLDLETRIKVLTPQGAEQFGEVQIPHSRDLRLTNFRGRTVLPDGQVVEIGNDALFESEVSRARRLATTKAVFPAVEPGAILDYRYTLHWDSFIDPEPWYFSGEVPTVHSQIEYLVPPNMAVEPWAVQVGGVQLQSSSERHSGGTLVRIWADNVLPPPDEPMAPPRSDLTPRFLLVPHLIVVGDTRIYLFSDWKSTCQLISSSYDELRGSKRVLRQKARELTAGIGSKVEQTEALFTYVRDEIETRGFHGVWPSELEGVTLGDVLDRGWGASLSKALLLTELLEAVDVEAGLVWSADRRYGRIDLNTANPYWFTRALVRARIDGEELWLDPADRDLGPGHLPPYFEGSQGVAYHPKKPEVVRLPVRPADGNRRAVSLRLGLDSEGALAGPGRIELSGNHAWDRRDRSASDEVDRWTEWLEETLSKLEISEVVVEDDLAAHRTVVTWQMKSREEEVFGDEVILAPAAPLGPVASPFTLDPARRLTPVEVPWADLDEVELELTWPEGWRIAQQPTAAGVASSAGRFEADLTIDDANRTLRYRRRFRIDGILFNPVEPYAELRALYQTAADHDVQPLILVAE